MTIPKLKLVLRDAKIKPACNEMELHPHFQQPELFGFCLENNIQPIGFCPIGSPTRPDRDKTESDTVDIEDPVVVKIAQRLNVHPAVVCVKWAVQRGQIPIPFSVYRNEYLGNIQSTIKELLTDEDVVPVLRVEDRRGRLDEHLFLEPSVVPPNGELAVPTLHKRQVAGVRAVACTEQQDAPGRCAELDQALEPE